MNDTGTLARYEVVDLAALVCAYAIYEFFLRRILPTYLHALHDRSRRAIVSALLIFLTMSICTAGVLSLPLVVGYLAIAALTFLYELLDVRVSARHASHALEWFLLRQVVSGMALVALWTAVQPLSPYPWYKTLEHHVLAACGIAQTAFGERRLSALLILTAYVFVIDGGTRIVRGVFRKFPTLYANVLRKQSASSHIENEENVGEWIGILERLITLTFVLTGSLTALAFALTAKSIARFKDLEDKEFAEYYLLGTSASLLVAMFAGMLVKLITGI
jgi:hypothetical protein